MADDHNIPKVLVVDDEPNIRELVQVALKFHGCAVTTAATGAEGLCFLGGSDPPQTAALGGSDPPQTPPAPPRIDQALGGTTRPPDPPWGTPYGGPGGRQSAPHTPSGGPGGRRPGPRTPSGDSGGFDLVVLDVMLPDIDGFEVCRRLRAGGNEVPVIFLTARDTSSDTVTGLALGGDDYVTKPFSVEALVARVRAVLRRASRQAGPVEESADGTATLRAGDLELDEDHWTVRRGGTPVELSPTEFRLLAYLMRNQGRMLTRRQILENVWGWEYAGQSQVLETYVSYLRRKLDPLGPPLIHTQRGVGYSLRPS